MLLKPRTFLFCTLAALIGMSALVYALKQQSDIVIVDIGAFSTQQAEEHAAVQRLSKELLQHPDAKAVRILAGRSKWRHGVMGYARITDYGQHNVFWMDNRFASPSFDPNLGTGIHATVTVSEEPIHLAAHHRATFDDVSQYDERLRAAAKPI